MIAAITGTGGGIVLLPILVNVWGIRDAIPIYAVAQLIGNLSRVSLNRSQIDWKVVRWFSLGAIPSEIVGSWCFTRLPDNGLQRLLGGFLILSILGRRIHSTEKKKFGAYWFAPVGAIFASISAMFGSAGPFLAPFFLSYGLTKSAFIGTEALGTAFMHLTKLAAYQSLGVINLRMWTTGILLGPMMVAGAFAGKRILDRIPVPYFVVVIDIVIVTFGLWFLFK